MTKKKLIEKGYKLVCSPSDLAICPSYSGLQDLIPAVRMWIHYVIGRLLLMP